MTAFATHVCEVSEPDGPMYYLTFLDPEMVRIHGLPPQAIIGAFSQPVAKDQTLPVDSFVRNRVFVEFMHAIIARNAPLISGFMAEAIQIGTGYVYVIDQRTTNPKGPVPPEDIIGVFEVKEGQLVQGSYKANPNHVLLSGSGVFRLGPDLESCLIEELETITMSVPGVMRAPESKTWWQRLWS